MVPVLTPDAGTLEVVELDVDLEAELPCSLADCENRAEWVMRCVLCNLSDGVLCTPCRDNYVNWIASDSSSVQHLTGCRRWMTLDQFIECFHPL